ncbi:uncharacterized protein LY89DRAFT_251155 [Mollisia scopiformis]|uniref:Uncharacterized protein n=1 Tax=Mollisia scopiformis TaxID=149040 RepID=A0A194WS67_MOLSC|nr:uncharacterized protein LY89DRAFT_251155 [Mollisia scopiformis]KUJ10815.1 hypothetical protein LY89DRAFT_251155 [Mollisia scopiformis]
MNWFVWLSARYCFSLVVKVWCMPPSFLFRMPRVALRRRLLYSICGIIQSTMIHGTGPRCSL